MFPGEISRGIAISTNCQRINRVRDPSLLNSSSVNSRFGYDSRCVWYDTWCLSSFTNFPRWKLSFSANKTSRETIFWKFRNAWIFGNENKIIKRRSRLLILRLRIYFHIAICIHSLDLTICLDSRDLIVRYLSIFFSFLFFSPPPNLFQIEIVNICAANFTINQFRRDTNRY